MLRKRGVERLGNDDQLERGEGGEGMSESAVATPYTFRPSRPLLLLTSPTSGADFPASGP